MTVELSAAIGLTAGGVVAIAATPMAIGVAERTNFYDVPWGYRQHGRPTPLLGGAAVLVGWLVAAGAAGALTGRLLVITGCAIGLWLLGTIDDAVTVAPKWRVLAEMAAAVALMLAGLGWQTGAPGALNIALTVFWTVGLVNAFNLMDNMDGSCGTVTVVAAIGVGVLASIKGQAAIAGAAFALAGAAAGFLRYNLARPARIFLGDGGSMLAGFLVAALALAAVRHAREGNAGLLLGALLVGLPVLDVTLVSVSRLRRGVTLVTGGRDHLTHRLLPIRRTPRSVAATLAVVQLALCGLAIGGYELGAGALTGFAFAAFVAGVASVIVLDTARWRPPEIAVAAPGLEAPSRGRARSALGLARFSRTARSSATTSSHVDAG